MFRWEKALSTLDFPADAVLHLFRSMRDVQLALPGLPAQEASAYLCQYATPRGVGTVAAFHLHKSNQLAFYLEAPHEVATDQAEAKLDQALVFVESMGFLLTNLDIQLLGAADRELLWSALPLQQGVQGGAAGAQGEAPPVRQPARRLTAKPATPAATTLPVTAAKSSAVTNAPPETNPQRETIRQTVSPGAADEQEQQAQANVDELLAAVEELRTRRSGLHARRPPPGPEELQRRRLELRESLGCVLASL